MDQPPQMRASHLQSNVTALADLGPLFETKIREAVADVIEEVTSAVRVAWLPIELDVRLTEAVEATCGPERLRQWSRDAIAHSADGPLLGPMLGALRRVGLTPHVGLKRAPMAWTLIYRGCGDVHYERVDDTTARLVQEGTPGAILESEPYIVGIAGAFDGAVALSGGRDARTEVTVELADRRVRYTCRWR